ncbi:WRKY transcription factor 19 [Phytophthora cinnamomi]|uniref:WRKY transcription factor 19 n=1 Tax=Phytophthora cinnamomi TaxID=4785 RepID=UPI00355AB3C3|nr:WRKY transcription factor 19 [Phytophthora cinnamomi]
MPASSTRRNNNRTRCRLNDCNKFAQTRGLCKAHGGGSRCRHPDCHKLAQSRGLCIAHGGGRRCTVENCNKLAQSKGHCISHGGGRRCAIPHCDKFSQVRGYCKAHAKVLMVFRAPSSPTCAALMTPPASAVASPNVAMSPVKSKLSIEFLVNPPPAIELPALKSAPVPSSTILLAPRIHLPKLKTSEGFIRQPSLLSFLEPASVTSAAALPQLRMPPLTANPLVLYR